MDELGEGKPILKIADDPGARGWMKRKLLEHAVAREKASGYMAPEDLSDEQRTAFEMALAEREKSTDSVLTVGVAAIDTAGNIVAVHNEGKQGHAEQLAITKLFELPNSSRALKCIVLVGGVPGAEMPEADDPRIPREAKPEDMCVLPCGKCREVYA